jgi:nucleotide-binding universal stress UspA family protein
MKRRLLCAADLTTRSDAALLRTAFLARTMDAEVMLVHAVDDSQSGRVLRMKVNRAKVRLMTHAERVMPHADAESVVRLGKPLQVITSVAREWEPDLIVMAAPRRRSFDQLLGTTAERLTVAARRPVLLVSRPAQASYGRVVFASDLSTTSAYAARAAADLGVLENSSTWAVHAFDPTYPGLIAADERTERLIEEHKRRWRHEVRRELLHQLERAGIDRDRVQLSAQAAEPVEAIERVIERVRPDLLLIGVSRWLTLKRMLIGSVSHQLLRTISCDILAVPPPRVRKRLLRAA